MVDRILCVGVLLSAAGALHAAEPARAMAFDFAAGAAKPGFLSVWHDTAYNAELGYGFDLGTAPTALTGGVTSNKPFYFSVAVPPGNYTVTIRFGDAAMACVSTVKAEARRLMLEKVETAAGRFETRTFAVNVRDAKLPPPPPNAPGGFEVRLSPREQGSLDWDEKLTLEFSNSRPCIDSIELHRADQIPTVFLAGDSTVTDQQHEPAASWGQMLPRFFRAGVAVANYAESGETLKSFLTGLRLDKILSVIRRGDYLFIQFGHNDMKENWPQTYAEASTTYKQYLRTYVAEARRRGAIPVLVAPMQRRNFDAGGKQRNTLGEYPAAVRQVAREESVALIDLTAMSTALYEALGVEKSWAAFSGGRDPAHHSAYGAYELAKCVVEAIRQNHLELARHLVEDFRNFDPAHPDAPEAVQIPPTPERSK